MGGFRRRGVGWPAWPAGASTGVPVEEESTEEHAHEYLPHVLQGAAEGAGVEEGTRRCNDLNAAEREATCTSRAVMRGSSLPVQGSDAAAAEPGDVVDARPLPAVAVALALAFALAVGFLAMEAGT